MLKDKLTKFERNRFFFGKLLTVADFNSEQEYFNNKRRLINRLTLGAGVVCGMGVIKMDEQTIAIESGLALDFCGREVVISEGIVQRLSDIEGFKLLENNQNITTAYLCAAYAEEQIEPVHSIAKNALADDTEGVEYNKIREGCKLFLTQQEPPFFSEADKVNKIFIPVFERDGVGIFVVAPKYVLPNEEFFVETVIRKSNTQRIEGKFSLELAFLTANGKNFVDIKLGEGNNNVLRTFIKATASSETRSSIKVRNAEISINGVKKNGWENQGEIFVSEDENAIGDFLSQSLEKRLQTEGSLYLARLNLIVTADYYVIDSIEREIQAVATPMQARHKSQPTPIIVEKNPPTIENQIKMKNGQINISIPKAVKGEKFFSKSVPHFLGVGEVLVSVALSQKGTAIFNDGVFDGGAFSWSVKTDKERGLFSVGVILKKAMSATEITFDWFALRAEQNSINKTLSLYPDIYYASPNETIAFEPRGGAEMELVWSVVPNTGGRISKKGVFTASNKTGFYEIIAKSKDEKISATAYVVI